MSVFQKMPHQKPGATLIVIQNIRRIGRNGQRCMQIDDRNTFLIQLFQQVMVWTRQSSFGSFQQNARRGLLQKFLQELPLSNDSVAGAQLL